MFVSHFLKEEEYKQKIYDEDLQGVFILNWAALLQWKCEVCVKVSQQMNMEQPHRSLVRV